MLLGISPEFIFFGGFPNKMTHIHIGTDFEPDHELGSLGIYWITGSLFDPYLHIPPGQGNLTLRLLKPLWVCRTESLEWLTCCPSSAQCYIAGSCGLWLWLTSVRRITQGSNWGRVAS